MEDNADHIGLDEIESITYFEILPNGNKEERTVEFTNRIREWLVSHHAVSTAIGFYAATEFDLKKDCAERRGRTYNLGRRQRMIGPSGTVDTQGDRP